MGYTLQDIKFEILEIKLAHNMGQFLGTAKIKYGVLSFNVKILQGKYGVFASFPSYKHTDGEYHRSLFCEKAFEKIFQQMISAEYKKIANSSEPQNNSADNIAGNINVTDSNDSNDVPF